MTLTRDTWFARTARLSLEARGAYVELALAAWAAVTLPDVGELKDVARVRDRRVWGRVWLEIEPLLTKVDGGYMDPWVEAQRHGDSQKSEKFSALGRRSAEARRARAGTAQPLRTVLNVPLTLPPNEDDIAFGFHVERPVERVVDHDAERRVERLAVVPPVRTVPETVQTVPVPYVQKEQKKEQQEQGASPEVDEMRGSPPVKVLTKLAHTILDECDAGLLTLAGYGEFGEELKTRAARAGLAYDGRSVEKALESADWQRARQTPFQCAVRLLRDLVAPVGPKGLAAAEVRPAVYQRAAEQYPSDAFLEWRDEVVRLAWEEATWRSAPGRLEYADGRLRAVQS